MDVSVIIVNYKSVDMVMDCINSIQEKTIGVTYEIIVVDNASGDGIEEKIEQEFGKTVHVILSDKNLGFGKANNMGSYYARGKYLFLLNPDTIMVNNGIKILFDYLEKHSNVGIVGGNLFTPDMDEAPSYCMVFDSPEREKNKASWKGLIGSKIGAKLQKISGNSNVNHICSEFNRTEDPLKVAYIFGADMMLSKKLFDEIGGFDPEFFMYAEEEELSWRITEKGYQIMNIPHAKIIHLEGATVKSRNEFSEKQFRMRMDGTLLYFKKCFGISGANEFYRYRSIQYQRLMAIAKIQGKLTDDSVSLLKKKILDDVYQEFLKTD